tara:strand:+ start:679 stop:1560 length:882 start_codon:yes stop_codon:yes gene_type:complete
MKITNKQNLPQAIVNAVTNDPYDASGSDISVTRLIAPPRIRVLEQKNWDLLTDDVSDRIFSLLGQSVHHVIERAKGKDDLAEDRLFVKNDDTQGWTLSGQFDYLTKGGELIDFKTTSAWSALDAIENGKGEWEQQLNCLDYLVRMNPDIKHEVKSLQILAILRDWSKLRVMQSDTYPRKQVVMIPITRWSPEEQASFVRERIKAHQDAELNGAPVCSPKERWNKPDSYAIMKDGRKTAARVLSSKELALEWLATNNMVEGIKCQIVLRKGEDVRCQNYCRVNEFCSHFMGVSF